SQRQLLDAVAAVFGIDGPPSRIEVYDNSHIQGTNAVGAMIVAGPDGLVKNAYRKFTIRGLSPAQAAPRPNPLPATAAMGQVPDSPPAASGEGEGPAQRGFEGQQATELWKAEDISGRDAYGV